MLWIWPLVIVAMVAVIAYLVTAELSTSTGARVDAMLACPADGEVVQVELQSDFFEPGSFRTVYSCSRFASGAPDCAMSCLELPREMIVRTPARLPVLQA